MYNWNMKKLYTSDFPRKSFFIIKSGWLVHFLHHSLYWCLCVSISSTFYCYSIILNVSLAFFPRKQCTLPTTLEKGKVNKYNYCIFRHINVLKMSGGKRCSLRSKRFRLVSEQKETTKQYKKKKHELRTLNLGHTALIHCTCLSLFQCCFLMVVQVWGQQWKEQAKGGRAQHVNIIQSTQVLMSQIAALRLSRWTLW